MIRNCVLDIIFHLWPQKLLFPSMRFLRSKTSAPGNSPLLTSVMIYSDDPVILKLVRACLWATGFCILTPTKHDLNIPIIHLLLYQEILQFNIHNYVTFVKGGSSQLDFQIHLFFGLCSLFNGLMKPRKNADRHHNQAFL